MPKKEQNPSSLWGKPLPANLHKLQTKEPKMATEEYEEDFDSESADVDAELSDDEETNVSDDETAADVYAEEATEEEIDETKENSEEEAYDSEAGDEAEVSYVTDEAEDDTEEPARDDNVAAVETTKEKKTKKKKEESTMKKRGSDYIREEIVRRREAGDSLRGVDIVKALAKKRVVVSAAQVSQLLKAEGVPRAPRGRQPAETPAVKPKAKAAPTSTEQVTRAAAQRPKKLEYPPGLPLDQLKAASAFLDACDGDYDAAVSILNVHRQVGSVITR
jgi:hypothetical protein